MARGFSIVIVFTSGQLDAECHWNISWFFWDRDPTILDRLVHNAIASRCVAIRCARIAAKPEDSRLGWSPRYIGR